MNHNGVLEWGDYRLLTEIIKAMRGENSEEYKSANIALKEIWDRLLEETHPNQDGNVCYFCSFSVKLSIIFLCFLFSSQITAHDLKAYIKHIS